MKKLFTVVLFSALSVGVIIVSCKKKEKDPEPTKPKTYASLTDYYSDMAIASQTYTFDASTGGTFITARGTKLMIKPNTFVDASMNLVTGNVSVEFKDVYSKRDILFSGVSTHTGNGVLKSAGEFFIKAMQGTNALLLKDIPIEVEMPANGDVDTAMRPFILQKGAGGNAWAPSATDSLLTYTTSYIFKLYDFSTPAGNGTWCNADNSTYFNAYNKTVLTVNTDMDPTLTPVDVYLIFTGINSMVHLYQSGSSFPYNFAPEGLACTVVAVAAKDGKIYSGFKPITISTNMTTTVNLTETTGDAFNAALNALN